MIAVSPVIRVWAKLTLACFLSGATDVVAQAERATDQVVRSRDASIMGTSLRIEVAEAAEAPGEAAARQAARLDAAIDAAISELRRVEDLMTDWRPSPLEDVNAAAGQGPTPAPPELAAIIARSLEVARITDFAFDPTYAAVGRLWDFKSTDPALPAPKAIEAALAYVGASRLRVDPTTSSVDLPTGMRLGLGGIAKGYGVDRAMEVLRKCGIQHAMVNAGGDLKVLGELRSKPWEIAIKHPRRREHAVAVIRVSNACVVTSGDYERFFEIEGRRYHHIIDPRDGHPSRGCISATIVGPNAELADALATAVCVLGPEAGLALVEAMDRYDAIVIGMDETVRATTRLQSSLTASGPSTTSHPKK